MSTILGHLAQFHSFAAQGGLLCTRGREHLLTSERARSQFATWLSKQSRVEAGADLTWHAAVPQQDGGRPDLEG